MIRLFAALMLSAAAWPANAQAPALGAGNSEDEALAASLVAARAFREKSIACGPGEIAYFPGIPLGDVFGEQWQQPPAARKFERPRTVRRGLMRWPAGQGQDGASVTTATLVDAGGRAVAAHAVCATAPAIDAPSVRAALSGRYAPARFDGMPGMGIVIERWRFRIPGPEDARQRARGH